MKVRKGKRRETHRYRLIEKVPLRDGDDAMLVNWIGFEILDAKGRVTYNSTFVTSLPVTKANVAEIVACGRARWKIENESFNVLKNHGYELEHNFGHGENYLAMTLAALNLLAFAWHTVLDLSSHPGARPEKRRKNEPPSSPISNLDGASRSFPPGPNSSKPSPHSPSHRISSPSKKPNEGHDNQARRTFRIAGRQPTGSGSAGRPGPAARRCSAAASFRSAD